MSTESIMVRVVQEAGNLTSLQASERFVTDLQEIRRITGSLRELGHRIVLTAGTFDLIHVGHARYTMRAKQHGDILIVGVDDDEKARSRKGQNRPVVPLEERMEMLAHMRYVDLVVVKSSTQKKWELIKVIRPDVLIAVEGTYSSEEVAALGEFCGEVVILPRQAETSTSAKARKLVLDGADMLKDALIEALPRVVDETYHRMREGDRA